MMLVEGLKVEFGVEPLFRDASFVINKRDRIASAGEDGAGKSILLKILNGQQKPTSGIVSIPNDTTIGYLPQVMKIADDAAVKEETRKAFSDSMRMREHSERIQNELDNHTDYESASYMELVEKFMQEHDRYLTIGGENHEVETERTLIGLGFTRVDFDRPTSELSGGWHMRVELAEVLLCRPDVLLLGGPTNHLDIESIQWLGQLLVQPVKAAVLISHDRAFIGNVINYTIKITCGHIGDYKVRYDQYVVLRAERREQQLYAYENQQKEIAGTRAFVKRFRYQATKAIQVQRHIRRLEKIEPIEVDEADNRHMHLKFPLCLRSGDCLIICDEFRKDHGSHTVFKDVTFTLKRGGKIAFVGKNGEGKSALVKCIMGEIPYTGTLKMDHNVQIGYSAQNQAQLLDEGLTIYEVIDCVATGDMWLKINDLLGAFMFGGGTSEKEVETLSGGECSRLAIIRLLLQSIDLLILDESANHLGMSPKDASKEVIQAFDGTVILMGHDHDSLNGLVSEVYGFDGGQVKEHLGGIYDFIRNHAQSLGDAVDNHSIDFPLHTNTQSGASQSLQTVSKVEKDGAKGYLQRKEQQKKIRRLRRSIGESEAKTATMEKRIAELNTILSQPESTSNVELVTEYTSTQRTLDAENERWTELNEKMGEL